MLNKTVYGCVFEFTRWFSTAESPSRERHLLKYKVMVFSEPRLCFWIILNNHECGDRMSFKKDYGRQSAASKAVCLSSCIPLTVIVSLCVYVLSVFWLKSVGLPSDI